MRMDYFCIYLVHFLFISSTFCNFSHINFLHILLGFYLGILFFICQCKLFCVLISNSNYSLLVYREANDCHILTSNSANSYNHLFQEFVVGDSLEFSTWTIRWSTYKDSFHFSSPMCITLICLSYWMRLVPFSLQCWIGMVIVNILVLLFILRRNHFYHLICY